MNSFFEAVLDKIANKKSSALKYVNINNKGDYVILLHGLNRTAYSMSKIAVALSESGYHVINYSYPSRKYSIDVLALSLLDKVINTHCINNKKKIHFVTHSLGGIILRKYLQEKPMLNIGRIVMITPPNHGSKWVDFLKKSPLFSWILGVSGKQLGSKSTSYVNHLPPKIECELGVIAATKSYNPFSFMIFKTKNDGTITVNSTKMVGMKDFKEIDTTHCVAPNNDEVIKDAVNFINYGFFN